MMNMHDLVRKRLEEGKYEYPDPAWVKEYEALHKGTLAPTPDYWWATCSVAEHYGIDPNDGEALAPWYSEVHALLGEYRQRACREKASID